MTEYDVFKKRTIKLLGEIISCESEKTDNDADFELIEECEELLCELIGNEVTLSDKEIQNRIEKITHQQRRKIIFNRNHPKKLSRAFVIFCAVIAFCISVGAVCVINPAIRDGIRTVLKFDVGEKLNIDGITFINGGTTEKYSNIEELLNENEIDVMYPHELPNGIKIDNVSTTAENLFPINIIFNDYNYYIGIYKVGTEKIEDLKTNSEIININGKTFFIKNIHDQWVALTSDDLYTYEISCPNESDLQIIMKGFN